MSARCTTLLFLSLALVVAALSLGTAKASAGIPGVSQTPAIDFCATASNVVEIVYGESQNEKVLSGPALYANSACGHFLIDVYVYGTGQPVPFWIGGSTESIIYPADMCNALTENVAIYKKVVWPATSFTRVAYGTLKGTWHGVDGCGLTAVYGNLLGSYSTSAGHAFYTGTGTLGDAIYRVAISAKLSTSTGTTWLPVTVDTGW